MPFERVGWTAQAWCVWSFSVGMAVLALGAENATAADLVVHIGNVSPKGGDVRLALYDERSYAGHDGKPIATAVAAAAAPETVIFLRNITPGRYAAKAFQDWDRSGRFKQNALGYPEEPFGFSNDAAPILDQPSFERASFELRGTSLAITITLREGL